MSRDGWKPLSGFMGGGAAGNGALGGPAKPRRPRLRQAQDAGRRLFQPHDARSSSSSSSGRSRRPPTASAARTTTPSCAGPATTGPAVARRRPHGPAAGGPDARRGQVRSAHERAGAHDHRIRPMPTTYRSGPDGPRSRNRTPGPNDGSNLHPRGTHPMKMDKECALEAQVLDAAGRPSACCGSSA